MVFFHENIQRCGRLNYFSLVFFFVFHPVLHGQMLDSLDKILHGDVLPALSFDSHNSFVSNSRAHIWGFKAGVAFSGKIQFGAGYSFLDEHFQKEIYFNDASGNPAAAPGTLHFGYASVYAKYNYFHSKHWDFTVMPVQLGIGNSKYKYEYYGQHFIADQHAIVLYEPGISVAYNIFRWIGAEADVGYRFMIRSNPAITENFNSAVYAFGINIYWGELYKIFFPGTKLAKLL